MKKTITFLAALALVPMANGQTQAQREICRAFASVQRNFAELRDRGMSLAEAKELQRRLNQKNDLPPELGQALLTAVERTYSLGWSPDATEISALAVCLDGLKE